MKLYFDDEDLFKVKISNKVFEDDIFYDIVYKKAAKQISNILDSCILDTYKMKDFDSIENPNNILGFVGDRGQGKTSAMLSFKNFLINNNTKLFGEDITKYKFQELGVIDPSSFEEYSNLINIILARMYKCFKNEYKRKLANGKLERELKETKISLLENFQASYNYLSLITKKESMSNYVDVYEQALENLSVIGDTSNFKKILSELINSYLKFMNDGAENSVLVLTIDDLDLDIGHTYKIIEQIRKYLIVPNLIILIAVKIQQLHRGIRSEYRKYLCDDIKDEAYRMATTYLRKVLPESRRIFMPILCTDTGDLLNEMTLVINRKESFNFQELLSNLLYTKTNVIALNFGKRKKYLYSGNLRELIEFYSLLRDMKNPKDYTGQLRYEIYQDNIDKFKEYFVYNWCTTNLNQEEASYIKAINKYSLFMKNRKVLKILKKIFFKNGIQTDDIDKMFRKKENIDQFYLLSEVYDSLEELKINDYQLSIEHVGKFIYAIQTYYSIIMNQILIIDEIKKINQIEQSGSSQNINYISEFIGNKVLGRKFYNNVPYLNNYGKSNVGELNLVRDIAKYKFNEFDLFMALVANKYFATKDINIYSHTGWSKLKYHYDLSDIFFRGLDIDYACMIFKNVEITKSDIATDRDIDEMISESPAYITYKKALQNVSRYIICNYDVYAFYNQWLTDHVQDLPHVGVSYFHSYVNLISNFLGQLSNDITIYFNYESQKHVLVDIKKVQAFLGAVISQSKQSFYFPELILKRPENGYQKSDS